MFYLEKVRYPPIAFWLDQAKDGLTLWSVGVHEGLFSSYGSFVNLSISGEVFPLIDPPLICL